MWIRDGVVIQHELASESLRREHEAAAERGDDVAVLRVAVTAGEGGSATPSRERSGGGSGGGAGPAPAGAPPPGFPLWGGGGPPRTPPPPRGRDRGGVLAGL